MWKEFCRVLMVDLRIMSTPPLYAQIVDDSDNWPSHICMKNVCAAMVDFYNDTNQDLLLY